MYRARTYSAIPIWARHAHRTGWQPDANQPRVYTVATISRKTTGGRESSDHLPPFIMAPCSRPIEPARYFTVSDRSELIDNCPEETVTVIGYTCPDWLPPPHANTPLSAARPAMDRIMTTVQ